MSLGLAGYGPDVRTWIIGVVLLALIGVASPSAASGGPRGGPPSTVFLAERPDLEVEVGIVGGDVFEVRNHGEVVCDNGTHHRQLFSEGIADPGHRVRIGGKGRFSYHLFLPAEGPAVLRPAARRITVEEVEEDNPTPAYFEAMRGRVTGNRVIGEIRLWEGPSTVPGKRHARCGTGSPEGEWLKFVAHRIHGPAQPDGHWKGR
jgi:hypothetical protein